MGPTALALALSLAIAAQEEPEWNGALFGVSLAGLADVDGDGAGDLLIGAPGARRAGRWRGEAWVVSGRTGRTLQIHRGGGPGENYGAILCAPGDVDGDGVGDLAIGAPAYDSSQPGYVELRSGATGELLQRLEGCAGERLFGHRLAGPGDVNGDCAADLALSVRTSGEFFTDPGVVRIHCGATGAVLLEVLDHDSRGFGAGLAAVGDVDGDAVPDLALLNYPREHDHPHGPLAVMVVSGREGRTIWRDELDAPPTSLVSARDADGTPLLLVGIGGEPAHLRVLDTRTGLERARYPSPSDAWGLSARLLLDRDGDGHSETLLVAEDHWFGDGAVWLRGSRDGRVLWHLRGRHEHLGTAHSLVPDLDGDGVDDLLLGAASWQSTLRPTRVLVVSGSTLETIHELRWQ